MKQYDFWGFIKHLWCYFPHQLQFILFLYLWCVVVSSSVWSTKQRSNPSRKLTLSQKLPAINSSLARGGTLCQPPHSMVGLCLTCTYTVLAHSVTTTGSRKCYFTVAIHHLWLLQSFCFLFCNYPRTLWRGVLLIYFVNFYLFAYLEVDSYASRADLKLSM